MERTLCLIKPDITWNIALTNKVLNAILSNAPLVDQDFQLEALKRFQMTKELAEEFYKEHKGKEFYDGLVEFMTSGPIVALVFSGENAVKEYRKVIGATNPAKAEVGTLRERFGTSGARNAVHGSDSVLSAEREIKLVFGE